MLKRTRGGAVGVRYDAKAVDVRFRIDSLSCLQNCFAEKYLFLIASSVFKFDNWNRREGAYQLKSERLFLSQEIVLYFCSGFSLVEAFSILIGCFSSLINSMHPWGGGGIGEISNYYIVSSVWNIFDSKVWPVWHISIWFWGALKFCTMLVIWVESLDQDQHGQKMTSLDSIKIANVNVSYV